MSTCVVLHCGCVMGWEYFVVEYISEGKELPSQTETTNNLYCYNYITHTRKSSSFVRT